MKLFISYSSKDRDAASFLHAELVKRGVDAFIDYDRLKPGEKFYNKIGAALDHSTHMIIFISEQSVKSEWVEMEAQEANTQKKAIFPVRLDDVHIPASLFFLRRLQYTRFARTDAFLREICVAIGIPDLPPPAQPAAPAPQTAPKSNVPDWLTADPPDEDVPDWLREFVPKANPDLSKEPEVSSDLEWLFDVPPIQETSPQIAPRPATRKADDIPVTSTNQQRQESSSVKTPSEKPAPRSNPVAASTDQRVSYPPNMLAQLNAAAEKIRLILPRPFDWCYIPAGSVVLEDVSEHSGTKGGKFTLKAFLMAQYPITNAQYEVFTQSKDGYADSKWWDFSFDAMKWRRRNGKARKVALGTDEFPSAASWYEAVAFCRWLTWKTDQEVVLPTEQHWQRAAQGDDGRVYPWGNQWDASLCNSLESNRRWATPVTQYVNGVSPYGVFDMVGNVSEWCTTLWGNDAEFLLAGEQARIVRGGAWKLSRDANRTGARSNRVPHHQGDDIGFRIITGAP